MMMMMMKTQPSQSSVYHITRILFSLWDILVISIVFTGFAQITIIRSNTPRCISCLIERSRQLTYSLYENMEHSNITESRLQLSVAIDSPVDLSKQDY